MRKLIGALLVAVMLLGLLPVQAEVVWTEWNEWNKEWGGGEWSRSGHDSDDPDVFHWQEAQGDSVDDLTVTYWSKTVSEENKMTTYYYDGSKTLTGSDILYFGDDGETTKEESYGADGKLRSTTEWKKLSDSKTEIVTVRADGTLESRAQSVRYENESGETRRRWITLEEYNEDNKQTRSGEILPDGTLMSSFLTQNDGGAFSTSIEIYDPNPFVDSEPLYSIYANYDKDGNFLSGGQYNPETGEYDDLTKAPEEDYLRDQWLKKEEVIIIPQVSYTWYPSNTVCSMGIPFRDVKPELTKKWYHFTPVDLSQDGEQVIPLVAGNKYVVGRVKVAVKGDEVLVTYMARGQGSADTFRVEKEFFTFFKDLASVTEVEPEKLGEGFKFGEPLSIEKDLEGDSKVLLFVRNVATYRNYYTRDLKHGEYWPNVKQNKDYREALKGLMD